MFRVLIQVIQKECQTESTQLAFNEIKKELLKLNFLTQDEVYRWVLSKLKKFQKEHKSIQNSANVRNILSVINTVLSLLKDSNYDQLYKLVAEKPSQSRIELSLREELISHLSYKFFSCRNNEKIELLKKFSNVKNSQGKTLRDLIQEKQPLFQALINKLKLAVTKSYDTTSKEVILSLLELTEIVQEQFNVDLCDTVDGFKLLRGMVTANEDVTVNNSSESPVKDSIDSLEQAIFYDGQKQLQNLIQKGKSFFDIVYILNPLYEKCSRDSIKYCITDFAVKCLEKEIKQKNAEIIRSHLKTSDQSKLFKELDSLIKHKEIWEERNSEMENANFPYEAGVYI